MYYKYATFYVSRTQTEDVLLIKGLALLKSIVTFLPANSCPDNGEGGGVLGNILHSHVNEMKQLKKCFTVYHLSQSRYSVLLFGCVQTVFPPSLFPLTLLADI